MDGNDSEKNYGQIQRTKHDMASLIVKKSWVYNFRGHKNPENEFHEEYEIFMR